MVTLRTKRGDQEVLRPGGVERNWWLSGDIRTKRGWPGVFKKHWLLSELNLLRGAVDAAGMIFFLLIFIVLIGKYHMYFIQSHGKNTITPN